jgi:hypothetical protein
MFLKVLQSYHIGLGMTVVTIIRDLIIGSICLYLHAGKMERQGLSTWAFHDAACGTVYGIII